MIGTVESASSRAAIAVGGDLKHDIKITWLLTSLLNLLSLMDIRGFTNVASNSLDKILILVHHTVACSTGNICLIGSSDYSFADWPRAIKVCDKR